jgi:hypothetical protein
MPCDKRNVANIRKAVRTYDVLLGYVCGIIWPADGGEWLDNGQQLCRLYNGTEKERNPKLHKTEADAAKRLAKMGYDGPEYQKFVRPYYWTRREYA